MTKSRNYDLIISLLVHIIIFTIPFSMILSRHFKEVEIFIIDDEPQRPHVNEKKPKPKPTPPPKQKVIQPQPLVEHQPQLIEPAVITTRETGQY